MASMVHATIVGVGLFEGVAVGKAPVCTHPATRSAATTSKIDSGNAGERIAGLLSACLIIGRLMDTG